MDTTVVILGIFACLAVQGSCVSLQGLAGRPLFESHQEFLKDVEANLESIRAAVRGEEKAVSPRQEDDDEESGNGLPAIVPGIIKVVGSALAGNISSVIESSVSLFPAEGNIGGKISTVLGLLVESVRNATGGGAASTNKATTLSAAASGATRRVRSTTAATTKTTESGEEESEENLRTNTSTAVPSSTVKLGTTVTTTLTSTTSTTTTDEPDDAEEPTTTPRPAVLGFGDDDRANWITLLLNGSDVLPHLSGITEDVFESSTGRTIPKSTTESKPLRGNHKAPITLNQEDSAIEGPGSFGSQLSVLLGSNKPNVSNFTDLLHKFDRLSNLTGLNRPESEAPEPEEPAITEVETTAVVTKAVTTATTIFTSESTAKLGPITLFPQFVTTEETTTTEDDDEDEEGEDDNSSSRT